MRPGSALAALLLALALAAAPARACRQALILALDVSSSVSQREYELQRDGLALALRDPAVVDMLSGVPGAEVMLLVFEWGEAGYQRVLLPWMAVTGAESLEAAAARIVTARRQAGTQATGIGAAMAFALKRFGEQPACARRTLDISGDGKNNSGPRPRALRGLLEGAGVAVNGLVVATRDIAEISAYYQAEVILGPGAFVETAAGFEDYARAMRRKLLRELAPEVAAGADAAATRVQRARVQGGLKPGRGAPIFSVSRKGLWA